MNSHSQCDAMLSITITISPWNRFFYRLWRSIDLHETVS